MLARAFLIAISRSKVASSLVLVGVGCVITMTFMFSIHALVDLDVSFAIHGLLVSRHAFLEPQNRRILLSQAGRQLSKRWRARDLNLHRPNFLIFAGCDAAGLHLHCDLNWRLLAGDC